MAKKTRQANSTWLDEAIGFFSPKAKMKRLQFKFASNVIKRKYEGATVGRRTDGWKTHTTDANAEILSALSKLRDRSRDMVRNNPWAARGLQVITANVVGKGIQTQIRVDGSGAKGREIRLNDMWKAWASTTACDFEGKHDLKGLQRLVMRSVAEGGEVVVRLRKVKRQAVRGFEVPPVQLQVLESDFIDSQRLSGTLKNGNTILHGIEFDKMTGKKIAYHLFKTHPGSFDVTTLSSAFETVSIPIDEIAHIYRVDRPGQLRGVPWMAPIMIRLRDLDEFEDAELVRQKVASMFCAFVKDLEGVDDSLTEEEQAEALGEKMEPGLIEILPPGKDVKLASPPSKEGYASYVNAMLHSISAGLGITYESLTGDLSQTNFSSARMGKIEMNRNIDTWQHQIMIPQFLNPAFSWFLSGAELIGQNTKGARAIWTPPARQLVDPTKEIPALKNAVRSGFMTLSEVIRQNGQDPKTHFEEMQKDNEQIDSLDLILDSDPRKTDGSGKSIEEPVDDDTKTTQDDE